MSRGSAVCLAITSAALLWLDWLPGVSVALVLAGLTTSVTGLVGYLMQSGPLINVLWFRSLALHTGLGLLSVQIAALATRPEREPFRALAQYQRHDDRRKFLLFAILILPLLLAMPVLAGMRAGSYDARFALALLVVLLMVLQTVLVWADSLALGRVESMLREKEAESSRILQSIGDAVIVTGVDGRIVRMNPLAEELTGWVLAEAVGRDLVEVFSIFSEETGAVVENPVDKVKRFGTVVGLANHTILRHREGRLTHIDDSSAPIRDDRGRLTGIVLIFRNVDDRKQSEALLRASDRKLRVALEAAQLGSWELDLSTKQMECSAVCKANFGRSGDEPFTYGDLLESIHPEDLPEMLLSVQQSIEQRKVYRAEYRVTWPDETCHWIVASGQVLLDQAGTPVRMVGVTLDVTDRHRSAEALLQSEKLAAVGRLAASIAHEINNPLESVTNLLYLVRSHAESDEVREYMAMAERELQRVSVITNQTLRFHKQSSNPKAVTCDELISGVLTIYQGKIVNSGVTVEKRKLATRPVVCFDGEIRQVLSNLIGNAIDAMATGGGGRLLLRSHEVTQARSGREGMVITVADTGGGMSARTAERIFEPFYTTKGLAGTGLGLWISHEIVARHEGTIRVRTSQRPGHCGTVFTVFLPFDAVVR